MRFSRVILLSVVLASGLRCAVARADNLAFFYALEQDLAAFKHAAKAGTQSLRVGGHVIAVLSIESHKVYAVKMGSGAVETALSAQALLARFQCDAAVSIGPVGALDDLVSVGAWYRAGGVVNYQRGSWNSNGFELSEARSPAGTNAAVTNLNLPLLFAGLAGIRIASGEIFVASSDYRRQLRELTKADAVDMNLFGLMSACGEHRIPLLSWRVVSDRADDNASNDFRAFVSQYDGVGGRAVAELIRRWPRNPEAPGSYPRINKLLQGK